MVHRQIPPTLVLLAIASLGTASAAAVSSLRSAATGQQIRSTPERLAQMQHHFSQVSLIHEAVIRGDLAALREPARQIAELERPREVPLSTVQHVSAMQLAAKRAADAPDLASAAAATASMLVSCGDCHRSAGTVPVPATPKRPSVGGLVGHMLEHQRAADEMLEGLFIPSTSQWNRGATRLRGAAVRPESLPRDAKLTPEIRQAEERVHQLADRALTTEGWRARAQIYGQMLTTCADCHGLHGLVWGPRRPPGW
jgi:mono/diheme cytochrome c family protein